MNDELFVIINNQLLKYLPRLEYNDICQTIHDKHHPSTRVTDYLCTLAYWHPDHLLIATNITRKCHYCQLNTSILRPLDHTDHLNHSRHLADGEWTTLDHTLTQSNTGTY